MTPLQQTATALLEQWGSPRMNGCLIDLRTALADEQAQAVEPVGYFCSNPAGDFRYQVSLTSGYPDSAPLYTHPAPLPATGERAKVGDSRFESWYSELQQAGKGSKQIAREAYEAGLNEAQQVAVPVAVLDAISRAGFMLVKTQSGYSLLPVGRIEATTAQGAKQ